MMNGGNILALQKILGYSTINMTMRYAHLSPDHLLDLDAVGLNPCGGLIAPDALMRDNSSQQLRCHCESKAKAKQWGTSPNRRVDWSWPEGGSEYAWRHPKRFEVAIWYRNLFLSGLGLGRPTWSGNKLRLDFLEASPKATPLTGLVTLIAVGTAEAYADAIGAVQLRIMSPINSKVKDHYLNSLTGYSYNAKGNYCYRDLA